MAKWKAKLENIFERADDLSGRIRYRRKQRNDFSSPLLIMPYLGFGNDEKIILKGRVLRDKGYKTANETDSIWRNLANMYRRFETDEIPFAHVKVNFQNFEKEVIADEEGYFDIELDSEGISTTEIWHEVALELLEPVGKNSSKVKTKGEVLIPPDTAKFGVISDIDDTIMTTNVASKLKMLMTTFLSNEHTRVPFEGVAGFYRALQRGISGNENNPFFYVSSSPWNLYTLLIEFFKKQEIPLGPIFLKDFGTHTIFNSSDHQSHKLFNIKRIIDTYPKMEFILIGDDGEQDPYIYRQIVRDYPERIRTVYIRKVKREFENANDIEKLIREVQDSGSQLVFAPDSEFAAVHAAGEGLISTADLAEVHQEKILDENSPKADEIIEKNL